mmetsp:Transcript_26193/g.83903  ORF Transcript_26193/g.83903 Transcript_26193/m.83903 type:complete len:234 (+) Transcript_26193:349-1050(+)
MRSGHAVPTAKASLPAATRASSKLKSALPVWTEMSIVASGYSPSSFDCADQVSVSKASPVAGLVTSKVPAHSTFSSSGASTASMTWMKPLSTSMLLVVVTLAAGPRKVRVMVMPLALAVDALEPSTMMLSPCRVAWTELTSASAVAADTLDPRACLSRISGSWGKGSKSVAALKPSLVARASKASLLGAKTVYSALASESAVRTVGDAATAAQSVENLAALPESQAMSAMVCP